MPFEQRKRRQVIFERMRDTFLDQTFTTRVTTEEGSAFDHNKMVYYLGADQVENGWILFGFGNPEQFVCYFFVSRARRRKTPTLRRQHIARLRLQALLALALHLHVSLEELKRRKREESATMRGR